ncbi:hypothetical protein SAMN04490357_0981 [Streptomyces misionensis]|uniref:Uncharacterized protein n=1 Tax=Streptomyces misionensis TaxID=67331 RepID=A0A1H4P4H7_9ACTN|nr:hypothetical protein [Streptomyces misionensis]SEC02088.1 hypothetical protein SAMN04490357_0981 [Streptomyces misionensis]
MTDMPVDGPFPIRVTVTPAGADLDVSAFLAKAVFTELITKADEDPEGLVEELADMAQLLRSAFHQGPDSHARHEYDERMQQLVDEFAGGGTIPVYGSQVGRLRDRLAAIATPRPVPAQPEGSAA